MRSAVIECASLQVCGGSKVTAATIERRSTLKLAARIAGTLILWGFAGVGLATVLGVALVGYRPWQHVRIDVRWDAHSRDEAVIDERTTSDIGPTIRARRKAAGLPEELEPSVK